jgi:hypothetical protein
MQVRTKTGRLGIGIFINVPEWSDMSSHSLVFISNAKKNKKSWSPLPNLFHTVTGNPKHTIIFLGLVCMYILPHVCIQIIFDLPEG